MGLWSTPKLVTIFGWFNFTLTLSLFFKPTLSYSKLDFVILGDETFTISDACQSEPDTGDRCLALWWQYCVCQVLCRISICSIQHPALSIISLCLCAGDSDVGFSEDQTVGTDRLIYWEIISGCKAPLQLPLTKTSNHPVNSSYTVQTIANYNNFFTYLLPKVYICY